MIAFARKYKMAISRTGDKRGKIVFAALYQRSERPESTRSAPRKEAKWPLTR